MAKLSKKEQDEIINKEIARYNKILKGISKDKKDIALRLIERVAFMNVTLQILEEDIKINGPTYLFEQGKQTMIVENPSQKSYNAMINRYTTACEKLFSLLAKEPPKIKSDGFDEFVSGREDVD
jgi:hypothetical protein